MVFHILLMAKRFHSEQRLWTELVGQNLSIDNDIQAHESLHRQSAEERLATLTERYDGLSGSALLRPLIQDEFKGKIALSSSFGAESAVLLHMIAEIDPSVAILYLNTGKLFPQTLDYISQLETRFGLSNIRAQHPSQKDLIKVDPNGDLWSRDTDACCDVRKVIPMESALTGFSAWITGRKRFQAATRQSLGLLELDGARIKVNPLATWNADDIKSYMEKYDLPVHPLVSQGYLSIGCEPCTSPVANGEDPRSGRWRGQDKEECGIHFINGKMVRTKDLVAPQRKGRPLL